MIVIITSPGGSAASPLRSGVSSEGRSQVPVLVVFEVPGGSSALDEALMEAWDLAGNPPPGNRLRLAGPTDDGWRVASLWDSREQFEMFLRDRLHYALDDTADRQPTVTTIWEIERVNNYG
jgi:hypothetical protein